MVSEWCRENDLSVNADKTILVPFTNKRSLTGMTLPSLNGRQIPFSKEVKYLGVTFDQKLTWNNHLDKIILKAKSALGISSRLAGKNWGINPKISHWLYIAIVRPIITYASAAWCNKVNQKTAITKLS